MKNYVSRFLLLIFATGFFSFHNQATAQIEEPVKWSFAAKAQRDNVVVLTITAQIDKGWHLYSQYNTLGITQATVFTYEKSSNYKLTGKTTEPKYVEITDDFGTDRYFENSPVVFTQKIEVLTEEDFVITGEVSAQACIEGKCILVGTDFEIPVKGVKQKKETEQPAVPETNTETADNSSDPSAVAATETTTVDTLPTEETKDVIVQNEKEEETTQSKSVWLIFFVSLGAGLLALVTPCVFPMIPMTISFFMKGNSSRKKGLKQAFFFGGSIIFIFTVLGLLLTLLLGKDAMYIISTHWLPNIIFFVIFMVFAFSFFGLFEITLPSSWINKSDQQSDKGGYLGSFFIALTTVLVSFSCTGPILGAALIGMTSGSSDSIVFTVSMLGFALGFALPFTLFAIFPQMLKKMHSGSWLNTVKIVFGFLEIALGLKFLSMADLSANWGILDRETYLALWIVTFSLLGFYLLGKLKFKGDSEVKQVTVPRLFLALATFSFVVYMIPGLWGAPLRAVSGFIPPSTTQDFDLERMIAENKTAATPLLDSRLPADRKYADQLHYPTGFDGFFDLEEAKAYAKKVNKPVFIDFTGKTCANCREMEYYVWTDPQVKKMLTEDYVMVALYADANFIKLAEEDWVQSKEGKTIKTLGKKNHNFQMEHFNVNAQPFYVLIDADGNRLAKPKAYDRNAQNFVDFLQEGLSKFKEKQ
ncbi:MAG: thioredoxin family protein [Bacteroidales bacterium]|jgi:thiol:disulfide interchange protein DsbD|nr:thioredoxin family protein [Bacteroidales bacterium]